MMAMEVKAGQNSSTADPKRCLKPAPATTEFDVAPDAQLFLMVRT